MDRFIIVFTDGAASGNPGPGGWGVIVVTPDGQVTELGGGAPHTTNNRMELSGAIAALEEVADHPDPVAIYTDSTYVIQGITQWIWGWRKRGWKTAQGSDVLNRDLWERLVGARSARADEGGRLAMGARTRRARPATSASTKSRWRSPRRRHRLSIEVRSTATRWTSSRCRNQTAVPKRPATSPAAVPRPPPIRT